MRVLMVGCGNMGGALLAQWVTVKDVELEAVAPSQPAAPVPVASGPEALAGRQFDVLVVAVKPQMIDTVMPQYRDLLRPGGALFSIAAGTPIAHLQSLYGAAPVVRIMPNLPSMIGRGVSGLVASDNADAAFRDLASRLSEAAGTYLWVSDEEALDRLTAISGCGSGYAFQMIESFERAARSLGFSDAEARTLVRHTMAGAAAMALGSDDSAADMKQAVMSKRGVTEAGVAQMTADDIMDNLMLAVVNAAYDRAREMAAGVDADR